MLSTTLEISKEQGDSQSNCCAIKIESFFQDAKKNTSSTSAKKNCSQNIYDFN